MHSLDSALCLYQVCKLESGAIQEEFCEWSVLTKRCAFSQCRSFLLLKEFSYHLSFSIWETLPVYSSTSATLHILQDKGNPPVTCLIAQVSRPLRLGDFFRTYSLFGNCVDSDGRRFHLSILSHIINFEGHYAIVGVSVVMGDGKAPECRKMLIHLKNLALSPEMEMVACYGQWDAPEVIYEEDSHYA